MATASRLLGAQVGVDPPTCAAGPAFPGARRDGCALNGFVVPPTGGQDGAVTGTVTELRIAHTADLDSATRVAARELLYDAFDDMTDADWEHALGGVHALVWQGAELIGHASVIQRRLMTGGRALRAGYVEGVAVRADRRGRGHGAAMMDALEQVVRGAYDLGALGAADAAAAFYAARGWRLWQGRLSALTPAGVEPTPDENGAIFVLPLAVPLDLCAELTCGWRDGDVW